MGIKKYPGEPRDSDTQQGEGSTHCKRNDNREQYRGTGIPFRPQQIEQDSSRPRSGRPQGKRLPWQFCVHVASFRYCEHNLGASSLFRISDEAIQLFRICSLRICFIATSLRNGSSK